VRVGYARVSTNKTSQDVSIDGQAMDLERAGCDRVIIERASAFKGARPGWDELWGLVAGGTLTEVLVIDQSRLSRSGDDLAFLAACAERGITVRALTGGVIEAETYAGFVSAGVLSVMNQAHSRLLAAKVRDGLARRQAAGYSTVSKLPFGYRLTDGRVTPCPTNWPAARARFDGLMAAGMNFSGWLRETKTPGSPTALARWLNHPTLRGFAQGQWGMVEPLITWQEWEQSQRLRQARSQNRGRSAASVRLFSGLVKCSECGGSLAYQRSRNGKNWRLKDLHQWCPWYGRSVAESVARRDAINALRAAATSMATLATTAPAEPAEATAIRAQLSQLEAMAASGVAGLSLAIDGLRAQLRALVTIPAGPRLDRLAAAFGEPGLLERASDDQLRPLLVEFLDRCVYTGQSLGIEVTVRNGVRNDPQ